MPAVEVEPLDFLRERRTPYPLGQAHRPFITCYYTCGRTIFMTRRYPLYMIWSYPFIFYGINGCIFAYIYFEKSSGLFSKVSLVLHSLLLMLSELTFHVIFKIRLDIRILRTSYTSSIFIYERLHFILFPRWLTGTNPICASWNDLSVICPSINCASWHESVCQSPVHKLRLLARVCLSFACP